MKFADNVWLTFLPPFIFLSKVCAGQDAAIISDNMKKFAEIYGFATQIMNLGGSFMGGGGSGNGNYGQSPAQFSNNFYTGNGAKPSKFEGFMSYKPMSSFFENKAYEVPSSNNYPNLGTTTFSEYGGGPLGAASSRSQPKSIIESLMGTFLGSSVDGPSLSNPYASSGDFGGSRSQTRSGSDIEAIVRSLTRSGAKRAEVAEPDHLNILSQFFGKRKK